MLSKAPVTTILPVIDMSRAREFYERKLGLKPIGFAADGNFVFACAGEATIALIQKPDGTHAEHTAISFEVSDVVAEVKELEKRGVEARPSFAAVCELLTAPDPNLRGQGMSLMFALYPEAFARIGKGASSADSPEVWRERLAAAEGEGSADCCI